MRKVSVLSFVLYIVLLSGCGTSWNITKNFHMHVIPKKVLKEKGEKREKEVIKKVKIKGEGKTEEVYSSSSRDVDVLGYKNYSRAKRKYKISVLYDNIPVYDVVVNVFRNVLRKNFIIDADLRIPVTVCLDGEFSEAELVRILNVVLESQGCKIVQEKGVYVVRKALKAHTTSLFKGGGWWFYRPKYLSSKYVYQIITELLSRSGKSKILGSFIFVADNRETILSIRNLVKLVDVDVFKS